MPYFDSTPLRRSPDAVSRVVAGETIVLDLASGHYFGLDPVGTRIWTLIGEKGTFGEVLAGLLREFEVEPTRAREDLERYLGELEGRALVVSHPTLSA